MLVGIWQVNTEDNAWLASDHATKVALLEDAVTAFWKAISSELDGDLTYPAMFVAPEYLFVHEAIGPEGKNKFERHHMDESLKVSLLESVFALTSEYPKMVIIPGSWLWRKPCSKTERLKAIRAHCSFVAANFAEKPGKLELGQLATAESQGTKARFLGTNEARIFMKGAAAVYPKMTDVSEAWDPEETCHVGGNDMVTVLINDAWFGIELCKDHAAATLKNTRKGRPVDVQVILSAHLDSAYTKSNCCCDPIRVVHACSLSEHSGVYGPNSQFTKIVKTQSGYPVNVSTLSL